jgi:hypothetical protein
MFITSSSVSGWYIIMLGPEPDGTTQPPFLNGGNSYLAHVLGRNITVYLHQLVTDIVHPVNVYSLVPTSKCELVTDMHFRRALNQETACVRMLLFLPSPANRPRALSPPTQTKPGQGPAGVRPCR